MNAAKNFLHPHLRRYSATARYFCRSDSGTIGLFNIAGGPVK